MSQLSEQGIDRYEPPDLGGRVAVVTGASRGAGRGIAVALGRCGATVYVTGRSAGGAAHVDDMPGSVEETASLVSEAGGRGIAVRCDHTRLADVSALVARVATEQDGGLDLLVNNAWGGYEAYGSASFTKPMWEHDVEARWRGMFEAGLRTHFLACHQAIPLMLPRKRGLVLSTLAWDRDRSLGQVYYDVSKHAVRRMIQALARELRPHGIAALAVAPGFMRSERVVATIRAEGGEEGASKFDWSVTETPAYVGRGIAALAADPTVLERTGEAVRAGDLAERYGFTDVDGRRIPAFALPE